jgi:hypothetical protein
VIGSGITGGTEASFTPVSGGTWSYIQDLPNNSWIVGWGTPTAASQQFLVNYPTAVGNIGVNIYILNDGFRPWTASLPAAWVEVHPSAPFDTFIMDLLVGLNGSGFTGTEFPFEIGLGPAGAEVSAYTGLFVMPNVATSGQQNMEPQPLSVPLAIKAGQRVAIRATGRTGGVGGTFTVTNAPPLRLAFAGV